MLDFTSDRLDRPTQLELEALYSNHQLMPVMREEFRLAGFEPALEACGIPVKFGIDLLIQMHLHKRIEPAAMIGLLRRHFTDQLEPAKACAQMLEKAVAEDLVNYDPVANQLIVIYQISADVQARLDQFQYPLPMIEEPSEVTGNRDTGYRTIRRSIILRNNHTDDDVCLDHINRVNGQKLALNPDVVAFVQNCWKNLDKKKEGESDEEFDARKRAFEKYDRVSRDVLDAIALQGGEFWLTHAYDKRGRCYAQGYHVNYQGTDWNKAVVQFAKAEELR